MKREREREREQERGGLVGRGIKVSRRMKGGGAGLPVASVGGLCRRKRGKQAEMEVTANPGMWSSAPLSEHDGSKGCSDSSLICSPEFVSVSVQTAVTHTSTYAG